MRHINLSRLWIFSRKPFPAYRCVLETNKEDPKSIFFYLPVMDIEPLQRFVLYTVKGKEILYDGYSKEEAEECDNQYLSTHLEKSLTEPPIYYIGPPELPKDRFQIIRTRSTRKIMIISEEDYTDRCLLMIDFIIEGARNLYISNNTCERIINYCYGRYKKTSKAIAFFAIMRPGDWFTVRITTRFYDKARKITWLGENPDNNIWCGPTSGLRQDVYEWSMWDATKNKFSFYQTMCNKKFPTQKGEPNIVS